MEREQTTIRTLDNKNKNADCEYCEERRKKGSNFCGRCGKQLKESPVIINYKP
ncbi:MAG: hypothetical protein HPZ00_06100 [Christensenellaceae bacterium]|nr:hypothetical protein [Christensenellaceae bacterium]DAS00405.1 MAG TPA: PROTEIN/RNA Complex, archaeal, ribosomal, 50S, protein.0A [Bacteriophage sp.]